MEMNYKNLLAFCSHHNMIGHDLESCLKVTSKKTDVTHQQDQPKPRVEPKQKFIQVAYKRHQPNMRDGNDHILEVIPEDNAIDNKVEHADEPEPDTPLVIPTRTNAVEQHNSFNALDIKEIFDEDISQRFEFMDATQFQLE